MENIWWREKIQSVRMLLVFCKSKPGPAEKHIVKRRLRQILIWKTSNKKSQNNAKFR